MFNQDYSDLLKQLSAHEANYVVVGAYAMAAHGYVRATGDIDIITEIDGLGFREVGVITALINGLVVPFLDLASLKRNKAATGRRKNQLDLELLKELDGPET